MCVEVMTEGTQERGRMEFNVAKYFEHLKVGGLAAPGRRLLHAASVSSTQEILREQFVGWEDWRLVFVADEQRAGTGRGSNTWASPQGCLMFSFQFTHNDGSTLPLLQHLVAVALHRAIRACAPSSKVSIKWPNDIYGKSRGGGPDEQWRKVGGILCQSSYWNNQFVITCGVGLNVTNREPSLCIADMDDGQDVDRERVLAAFLNQWEILHGRFAVRGLDSETKAYYEQNWMHTGQRVTTDNMDSLIIDGITNGGYLRAHDERTGVLHELHPDGNSLDWMRGLIKKKM